MTLLNVSFSKEDIGWEVHEPLKIRRVTLTEGQYLEDEVSVFQITCCSWDKNSNTRHVGNNIYENILSAGMGRKYIPSDSSDQSTKQNSCRPATSSYLGGIWVDGNVQGHNILAHGTFAPPVKHGNIVQGPDEKLELLEGADRSMTIERRLDGSVKSLIDASEASEYCRCEIVVNLLTVFCFMGSQ